MDVQYKNYLNNLKDKDHELYSFLLLTKYDFINNKATSIVKDLSYTELSYNTKEKIVKEEYEAEQSSKTIFIEIDPDLFDLDFLDILDYKKSNLMFAVKTKNDNDYQIITEHGMIKKLNLKYSDLYSYIK